MPEQTTVPPIPDKKDFNALRDWRMTYNQNDYPLGDSYHEGFAGIVGCTTDRWCKECEHRIDVPHRLDCSVTAKELAMVTPCRWTKLPALDGRANPCGCCPPIPAKLPMDAVIAVGFGSAYVSRDGDMVLDGERAANHEDRWVTLEEAEALASADPDHDWQVVLHGPLHGETYQRHGPEEWNLIEKNQGFA